MDKTQEIFPPPAGFIPLMISGKEMEKYELKSGPGIRDTLNFKCFDKDFVLNDIQTLGFYSSFHKNKKEIEAFPGPEILIVADKKQKYGENWLLCLTISAYDQYMLDLKQAAEAEDQIRLEAELEAKKQKEEEEACLTAIFEEKPIIPGKWESSTMENSHKEVEDLTVSSNRPLLGLIITRPKRENLRNYKFTDRDADQCLAECRQHKDPNYELIRMEKDIGLQAVADLCKQGTQTSWFRSVNSSIQYYPVSIDNEKALKCLQSADMIDFLHETLYEIEEVLKQNETIDIFMDEFSNLVEEDAALGNKSESNIKELRTFTDLEYSKNKVLSAIDWHPRKKGVVGVAACINLKFDQKTSALDEVNASYVLIWNFADLTHPQFMLESPHDIYAFRFNPSQPQYIAAGTSNGQVILWNIPHCEDSNSGRRNSNDIEHKQEEDEGNKQLPPIKPYKISHIDSSHRRTVADLIWLPSGWEVDNRGQIYQNSESKSYQFVTIAGDGQVCFWDIRIKEQTAKKVTTSTSSISSSKQTINSELIWTPFYKLALTKLEGAGDLSLSRLSLQEVKNDRKTEENSSIPSSSFYVTTEEGEIVCGDWRPHLSLNTEEEGTPDFVQWISQDHYRPCVSLQRSPFFKDILLSVGDWSFNLWKEGVKQPIFSSSISSCYLTSGRWSPTRPGVLIISKSDGNLDVWDLLDQSHRPSLIVAIAPSEITSMEFWNNKTNTAKQQLLAVGDSNGNLHILNIPRNLWRQMQNEKSIMEGFLQREIKRVAYIKEKIDQQTSQNEIVEISNKYGYEEKEEDEKINNLSFSHLETKADEMYKTLELAFRDELGIHENQNQIIK